MTLAPHGTSPSPSAAELSAQIEALRAERRQALSEAEARWRLAMDDLRQAARQRMEDVQREHAEDLEVLRREQAEEREALEDRLRGELEAQHPGEDAAATTALADQVRRLEAELAAEREAHRLDQERLASKESELEQRAAALSRDDAESRAEIEALTRQLREERERAAAAAAMAEKRTETVALEKEEAATARRAQLEQELADLRQHMSILATAIGQAYEDIRQGAGREAQVRLQHLVQELVRDFGSAE